jgi:hypothetical protein
MRGAIPPLNTPSRCGAKLEHRDIFSFTYRSRDSSVGIATGYRLDDRMIGVRFTAGAGNFSLLRRVQTGSGAHPASYPMGTWGYFPEGKAAEA